MGKFKQISITIKECIKYIFIGIALVSTILVLKVSAENVKLKEHITLIEKDRGQMMREIKELQK